TDGRVLAHSDIGAIGKKLSLPSGGVTKRILGDSVLFESGGAGRPRLLTATTEVRRPPWVVVAVQPLGHLLAQVDELRHKVHSTAESAANEMAREAGVRSADLERAAAEEQRSVAAAAALHVRQESQKLARGAVGTL